MAQLVRVDGGQKVPAFNQHVAGNSQLHAGGGLQQGAVVTNAQRHTRIHTLHHTCRGFEVALNQVKLAHAWSRVSFNSVAVYFLVQSAIPGWP